MSLRTDETLDKTKGAAASSTPLADASQASSMQRVGRKFNQAVQKSAREQPMATLAVVALISIALGALWRS
jgi:hypothetical protein